MKVSFSYVWTRWRTGKMKRWQEISAVDMSSDEHSFSYCGLLGHARVTIRTPLRPSLCGTASTASPQNEECSSIIWDQSVPFSDPRWNDSFTAVCSLIATSLTIYHLRLRIKNSMPFVTHIGSNNLREAKQQATFVALRFRCCNAG
jgi:hypothetical protein